MPRSSCCGSMVCSDRSDATEKQQVHPSTSIAGLTKTARPSMFVVILVFLTVSPSNALKGSTTLHGSPHTWSFQKVPSITDMTPPRTQGHKVNSISPTIPVGLLARQQLHPGPGHRSAIPPVSRFPRHSHLTGAHVLCHELSAAIARRRATP